MAKKTEERNGEKEIKEESKRKKEERRVTFCSPSWAANIACVYVSLCI